MGYDVMTMGTLYLNGFPKDIRNTDMTSTDPYIPQYRGRTTIAIGDTVPGKAITWIRPNGMNIWVANQTILTHVSADTLAAFGFDEIGTSVCIDGVKYICRLPFVGAKKGDANEWDSCLRNAGGDDDLWHWSGPLFWGAETAVQSGKDKRYVGGGKDRRKTAYVTHANYPGVGFRPILVPKHEDEMPEGRLITLDGEYFLFGCARQCATKECRPYLWPLVEGKISDDFAFSVKAFSGLADGTEVSMYSLLMDGQPVRQDDTVNYNQGSQLELTDKFYGPEYLIRWVIVDGKAVAAKSVISGISNKDMALLDLILPL